MNKFQSKKETDENLRLFFQIVFFSILIFSVIMLCVSIVSKSFFVERMETFFITTISTIVSAFSFFISSNLFKQIFNSATNFFKSLFVFEKNEIENPAFSLLLKIADLLPRKQRQILQQEARDMKEECDEAKLFGKPLRAKIIVVSYYIGIGWSVFMWIANKIKEVFKITLKKG